jgi:streptomycin 6-kinase
MLNNLNETWITRADSCIQEWELSSIAWQDGVSTAHVAMCESPAGAAVLKVSIEPGMISDEAEALDHFGTSIAPEVFQVSQANEAILLSRIDSGGDLSSLYPNAAQEIDVWLPLFKKIVDRSDVPSGFPYLSEYAHAFDHALSRRIPSDVSRLMQIASDSRQILMAPTGQNRLLHGDLHHFNILLDIKSGWKMIDPHGVIGNPLYELGAFLRNPWVACYQEPGLFDRLEERVNILAERLYLPVQVISEFGFFGAAISIAWTLEGDGTGYEGMVLMSEACLRLRGF